MTSGLIEEPDQTGAFEADSPAMNVQITRHNVAWACLIFPNFEVITRTMQSSQN